MPSRHSNRCVTVVRCHRYNRSPPPPAPERHYTHLPAAAVAPDCAVFDTVFVDRLWPLVDRLWPLLHRSKQIEFSAAAGTHKRKDITDLARLEQFLVDKSLGHAFDFIFKGGQS